MNETPGYGVIPFRRGAGQIEYLLINSALIHNPRASWEFPKGLPKAGESPEDCARREFWEETRLSSFVLIDGFAGKYRYSYRSFDGPVTREVTLFLGEVLSGDPPEAPTPEHRKDDLGRWWQWLPASDVVDVLFFPERRDCFRQAHGFLTGEDIRSASVASIRPHDAALLEANNVASYGEREQAGWFVSLAVASLERCLDEEGCIKMQSWQAEETDAIPATGHYVAHFAGALRDDNRYCIYSWPNAPILFYVAHYNKDHYYTYLWAKQFAAVAQRDDAIRRLRQVQSAVYGPVFTPQEPLTADWAFVHGLCEFDHDFGPAADFRKPEKLKLAQPITFEDPQALVDLLALGSYWGGDAIEDYLRAPSVSVNAKTQLLLRIREKLDRRSRRLADPQQRLEDSYDARPAFPHGILRKKLRGALQDPVTSPLREAIGSLLDLNDGVVAHQEVADAEKRFIDLLLRAFSGK
jgi:8-oxo-dGTP pyrophosphatase MutT (NUDIX family)